MMRMKTRAVRPPVLPPPATLRDFLELPFFILSVAFVVCHLVARLRLQLILVVRLFGHFLLLPGERRRWHRDPMKCAAQYGLPGGGCAKVSTSCADRSLRLVHGNWSILVAHEICLAARFATTFLAFPPCSSPDSVHKSVFAFYF